MTGGNIFILAKKKEIYHEWELIDEAICLNDLSLKKDLLGEYFNDIEMNNIINTFIKKE